MNEVSKRFLEFYDFLKKEKKIKSIADFCRKTLISTSNMNEIKQGRSNCGSDTLQKVKDFYSFLNSNWILTGEGQMINDPTDIKKVYRYLEQSENVKFNVVNKDSENYGLSRDELKESLLKQISQLEKIIELKDIEIERFKKIIDH